MKKSEFYEIIGTLFSTGQQHLAKIIARSPLCNVPEPKRREMSFDDYKTKKFKEKQRYHFMSPAEKEEKVENTRKKRMERKNRKIIAELLGNNT